MHRNTYLLISALAVIAALVVGVNLGKKITPGAASTTAPSPTLDTNPTALQQKIKPIDYINTYCGIGLQIPATLTKLENATGSAILVNPNNQSDTIAITCQKDIPRPPLPQEKIKSLSVPVSGSTATVSGNLYHSASAETGTAADEIIFRHPKTGMDVFIGGYGETYNQVILTLQVLP